MTKTLRNHLRVAIALATAAIVWGAIATRATVAAESGNESIGSQLLDDLDPSLFGPSTPEAQGPARPDSQKRILPGRFDDRLGEDIGQAPASEPLARIERGMTSAASLIRASESLPQAGEVQRQVVAELD